MERITKPEDLIKQLQEIKEIFVAKGEDALYDGIAALRDLINHLKEPRNGVNPATVSGVKPRSGYKANVSIMRLWLQTPVKSVADGQQRTGINTEPLFEENRKDVTLAIWDGHPDKPNLLEVVRIAEKDFIEALSQAFPRRELWVESGVENVNTDLLIKLLKGEQ